MNAGLPGAGIGGLFFVICALLAPLFEFVRVLRGRSSVERRRRVAHQFFLAVGIIILVERAFFIFALLDDSPGQGTSTAPLGGFHLPLAPVLLSLGVLVLVLGLTSFLSLFKSQGRPPQHLRARPDLPFSEPEQDEVFQEV